MGLKACRETWTFPISPSGKESTSEIDVNAGDAVHVARVFSDVFCIGHNLTTAWVGNFPLSCVEPDDVPGKIKQAYKRILPHRNQAIVAYQRIVPGLIN